MLSAGDGGRSVIGGRAGADGVRAARSRRSPSATRRAKSSSTLRRLATIRARMPGCSHLRQLEHERVDDVRLLDRRLADVELAGLAVVVGEALRADPLLRAVDRLRRSVRVAAGGVLARAAGVAGPRVRLVVDPARRG